MDNYFRDMFEALNETADGLIAASLGLKKMADAALHAQQEHEDLRETVQRLEALVLELIRKQNGHGGTDAK